MTSTGPDLREIAPRTPMPLRVKQMLAFSLFLWVIGLALLIWADWRIALGVFVVLWANNILRK